MIASQEHIPLFPAPGLIAYDFLFCQGGAEQLTLELARGLKNADLCVAFRDRELFTDRVLEGIRCRELGSYPRLSLRAWRTLSGLHVFRRHAGSISDYDWALFSGSNAPVAVHHRPGGRNLYYCHTLPRFAYDLHDWYMESLPFWQRPAFRMLAGYVRSQYEAALARMDTLIANSENVRGRLRHYLGMDSEVIHPPCDVTAYQWLGQGDYYLSTARLEPYKRVDRIIQAFRHMPDKKLVVASGGSDENRLRNLARDAENIRFTGWVGDRELKKLVGTCIATIYVAKDEDFGMSPVESMAAGKPVIANAEGGLLETVVNGETGIFVPADPSPTDIADAVRELTAERSQDMRRACENRAGLFSRERFLRDMKHTIEQACNWS